ncbi:hypothetical protein M427DRAFT_313812 [Gonapodya prolifera JEL478]|uniref:Ankyrin n=1 Tax=Gonapodya prolifera (strain JEL478) TaxID=1344416 RepID=A0A139AWW8_GONPJ|nr:hypothetical protein M427DRAFT_313812 [Gonapodya prolifera JEL478]|eukprot:KXS21220.1 hypothetical protein M427DRAFT_313812 [Gonapodya prolifera JEL478]
MSAQVQVQERERRSEGSGDSAGSARASAGTGQARGAASEEKPRAKSREDATDDGTGRRQRHSVPSATHAAQAAQAPTLARLSSPHAAPPPPSPTLRSEASAAHPYAHHAHSLSLSSQSSLSTTAPSPSLPRPLSTHSIDSHALLSPNHLLILAAESHNLAALLAALAKGANPNARKRVQLTATVSHPKRTPLLPQLASRHAASFFSRSSASAHDTHHAQQQLSSEVLVDALPAESALALAIRSKNVDVISTLLDHGADPTLPISWQVPSSHPLWTPTLWQSSRWSPPDTLLFPSALSFSLARGHVPFNLPGARVAVTSPRNPAQCRVVHSLEPDPAVVRAILARSAHSADAARAAVKVLSDREVRDLAPAMASLVADATAVLRRDRGAGFGLGGAGVGAGGAAAAESARANDRIARAERVAVAQAARVRELEWEVADLLQVIASSASSSGPGADVGSGAGSGGGAGMAGASTIGSGTSASTSTATTSTEPDRRDSVQSAPPPRTAKTPPVPSTLSSTTPTSPATPTATRPPATSRARTTPRPRSLALEFMRVGWGEDFSASASVSTAAGVTVVGRAGSKKTQRSARSVERSVGVGGERGFASVRERPTPSQDHDPITPPASSPSPTSSRSSSPTSASSSSEGTPPRQNPTPPSPNDPHTNAKGAGAGAPNGTGNGTPPMLRRSPYSIPLTYRHSRTGSDSSAFRAPVPLSNTTGTHSSSASSSRRNSVILPARPASIAVLADGSVVEWGSTPAIVLEESSDVGEEGGGWGAGTVAAARERERAEREKEREREREREREKERERERVREREQEQDKDAPQTEDDSDPRKGGEVARADPSDTGESDNDPSDWAEWAPRVLSQVGGLVGATPETDTRGREGVDSGGGAVVAGAGAEMGVGVGARTGTAQRKIRQRQPRGRSEGGEKKRYSRSLMEEIEGFTQVFKRLGSGKKE